MSPTPFPEGALSPQLLAIRGRTVLCLKTARRSRSKVTINFFPSPHCSKTFRDWNYIQGTDAIRANFSDIKGSGAKNSIGKRHTMVLNDNAVVVTGFYDFSRLKDRKAQSSRSRFTMLPVSSRPSSLASTSSSSCSSTVCPPWPRPHLCHVRLQSYWVCRRTERAFARFRLQPRDMYALPYSKAIAPARGRR